MKRILFILKGVEETSIETISLVEDIKTLMQKFKIGIRKDLSKIYSQDLLNNLFRHPYTKIDFVMKELNVSRPTASSYLAHLENAGYIKKMRIGRDNFYVNIQLYDLLLNEFHDPDINVPSIESTDRI